MKRILVVYYSRTGSTKKVAEIIAQQLAATLEELQDTANYRGAVGYFLAGKTATLRQLSELKPLQNNPADFDLVIIGTPIWSWNMSTPIRSYLTSSSETWPPVAFFCTQDGSGAERAFKEMSEITKRQPLATLALTTKEVISNLSGGQLIGFISKFKN